MDKRDQFEKKIKEKLEEISLPYLDEAWEKFAPSLYTPTLPFWKHWSLPYLFASILFLVSLAWHLQESPNLPSPSIGNNKLTIATTDTIYIKDTVYVIDTVFVKKRVVVQSDSFEQEFTVVEKPNREWTASSSNPLSMQHEAANRTTEISASSSEQNSKSDALKSENGSDLNPLEGLNRIKPSPSMQMDEKDSLVTDTTKIGRIYSGKPKRGSMVAPSIGQKEKIEFRLEKELVVGDTSNLRSPPIPSKTKPMFQIEAVNSLLFPISRSIDYYNLNQQGIQIGLEWDNGWGIFSGAIRNQMEGELDEEEIMKLSPLVLSRLPNLPDPLGNLDEIFIKNHQWFFPLELRWRSLYYNGFSFESSFGMMGNYLIRQDFTYELENDFSEEYQFGATKDWEFSISHLRVGLGTNYLFSKRLGLFLRSHYWHPISKQGLVREKTHGLELGVGVSVFLGR